MFYSDPGVSGCSTNPHIVCPPDLLPRGLEGNQRENMGKCTPLSGVQSLPNFASSWHPSLHSGNSCWAVSVSKMSSSIPATLQSHSSHFHSSTPLSSWQIS